MVKHLGVQVGRDGVLRNQSPPRHVAGIDRGHFRKKLRPHRRAQSVGADQQVSLGNRTVGEPRYHPVGTLLDRHQLLAAMVVRRRKCTA